MMRHLQDLPTFEPFLLSTIFVQQGSAVLCGTFWGNKWHVNFLQPNLLCADKVPVGALCLISHHATQSSHLSITLHVGLRVAEVCCQLANVCCVGLRACVVTVFRELCCATHCPS